MGFFCPLATTLGKLHQDPDRLRTPLVRRDGVLVEATWDEAYAAVAEGLGRIWADGDRDAVAVYLGNPTAHSLAGAMFAGPLIKAVGTKNVFSASTVDQMPKHVSSGYLFGNANAMPVPDLDRTDYLLMLGANPFESNGSLCTAPDFPGRMAAIRERGGRIITVDPRRTKTAAASDEHLAIRPGTDALWLAALVTEIDRAGLVDVGAIAEHVDGVDVALAALAPLDADTVAAHTRIGAATTLLYHLTTRLLYTKWRDPGEAAKLHLFGQLKRITKQWLDECLVCSGIDDGVRRNCPHRSAQRIRIGEVKLAPIAGYHLTEAGQRSL